MRDVNNCLPIAHTWRIAVRFSTYGVQVVWLGLRLAAFPTIFEVRLDGPNAEVYSVGCQ